MREDVEQDVQRQAVDRRLLFSADERPHQVGLDHYMPEIFYHDRAPILSVCVHPEVKSDAENVSYKVATTSMQHEVRLWLYTFEIRAQSGLEYHFLANLPGHKASVNLVRFSPNGKLMASGDSEGRVIVWQQRELTEIGAEDLETEATIDSMPSNREHWLLTRQFLHNSDVTAMDWTADSKFIATASTDNSLALRAASTGQILWQVNAHRNFPNGLAIAPTMGYLVTMSTDRRLDVVDMKKGRRLRSLYTAPLPDVCVATNDKEVAVTKKMYKLFHDSQLQTYQRSPAFSPCGRLLVVPAAHIEAGADDLFGTYVYRTDRLDCDTPTALLPSSRPTFVVRFCPILFELDPACETNYLGLPYRALWLALTKDTVLLYDSQHAHPVGVVSQIHYNSLTDASWSSDGRLVLVASLEGYCSLLRLDALAWGTKFTQTLPPPPSPKFSTAEAADKENREEKKQDPNGAAAATLQESPDRPRKKRAYTRRIPTTASGKKDEEKVEEATTPKQRSAGTGNTLLKFFTSSKTDEKKCAEGGATTATRRKLLSGETEGEVHEEKKAPELVTIEEDEGEKKEKKRARRIEAQKVD